MITGSLHTFAALWGMITDSLLTFAALWGMITSSLLTFARKKRLPHFNENSL